MRISAVALSVIACLFTISAHGQEADATQSVRQPESLSVEGMIPVTPCRLLDTRVELAGGTTAGASRSVAIQGTRCATLVAPNASAYVVRVSRFDWRTTSDPQFGRDPQTDLRTIPVAAPGLYDFPVPASGHIAVDLEGYLLPPGSRRPPTAPAMTVAGDEGRMSSAAFGPRLPVANNEIGSRGSVFVDGSVSPYQTAGVFMKGSFESPYVTARTLATPTEVGGFMITAANDSTLSLMRPDGVMWVTPNGYLSGRSDYQGGSTSTIPSNIVHRVNLLSPTGGSPGRLTFFSAVSGDESGSPGITKYEASTLGLHNALNINFDSQFHFHTGTHYYYRAFSRVESKETFWLKAAGAHADLGTRADMYVSGDVGIGAAPAPGMKLFVVTPSAGAPHRGIVLTDATDSTLVLRTLGGGIAQLATDGGGRQLSFATGLFQEAMRIDGNGNVGIGTMSPAFRLDVNGASRVVGNATIGGALTAGSATVTGNVNAGSATVTGNVNAGTATIGGNLSVGGTLSGGQLTAKYQDIAEWVPATADLEPGTVVILNPEISNEVMASVRSYDTTVAGVVSAAPGLLLGEGSPTKEQIATTGRVKVKVDATAAAIRIGDILVTSDKPGTAMKSQPVDVSGLSMHRPGTIIGKALEPLASGTGEILVLLSMQ